MQQLLTKNAATFGTADQSVGDFLNQLCSVHGRGGVIGRFFLAAERAVRERGVRLEFGSFDDLVETNRRNFQSWSQLNRAFDASVAPIPRDRAFCILGRDRRGQVVATQAARFYDIGDQCIGDVMQSLRLFFPDTLTPEIAARETCEVTAPAARRIRGRVVYSGGGWYHPDFRGCSLSALLPRMSRAYAYTRWNSDYTVTWVVEALIRKGVLARYGYTNFEWGVRFSAGGQVYYEGAFAWMHRAQMLGDLARSLSQLTPDPDVIPRRRSAQDVPSAAP
jgi:hypothetical protein